MKQAFHSGPKTLTERGVDFFQQLWVRRSGSRPSIVAPCCKCLIVIVLTRCVATAKRCAKCTNATHGKLDLVRNCTFLADRKTFPLHRVSRSNKLNRLQIWGMLCSCRYLPHHFGNIFPATRKYVWRVDPIWYKDLISKQSTSTQICVRPTRKFVSENGVINGFWTRPRTRDQKKSRSHHARSVLHSIKSLESWLLPDRRADR